MKRYRVDTYDITTRTWQADLSFKKLAVALANEALLYTKITRVYDTLKEKTVLVKVKGTIGR